jgi:hypothetical protein
MHVRVSFLNCEILYVIITDICGKNKQEMGREFVAFEMLTSEVFKKIKSHAKHGAPEEGFRRATATML